MNSFKQHIRETSEAPTDPRDNAPRTLLVTVEDLRDALGILGDDRTLEVKLDYPEFDSISVNLIPQVDETEH
jgi:hypothetical protein